MRTRFLSFATILVVLGPVGLFAADRDGKYVIYGRGNNSCANFAGNIEKNAAGGSDPSTVATFYSELAFVDGYLTAINDLTDDTYAIDGNQDASGRDRWLYEYCRQHPLDLLAKAVTELVDILRPERVKQRPVR